MATRDELILAVGERYGRARLAEKRRILDEFVAVTGITASMRCACFAVGNVSADLVLVRNVGSMMRRSERR